MKLAASFLLLCSMGFAQAAPGNAPDIFLITIDTLRADHVGCFGYDKIQTPALDSLAKDGVRFAQAFTASPITNSSHTTILTGLLPSSHGVTDFADPLADSHPTMAELLKHRGYRTAAFIGAIILDSKTLAPGLDQGFDFYDNFPARPKNSSRWGYLERRAETVSQHAQKWMASHLAGPRFVWMHFYDPHDPYEAPPPYAQNYKDRPYDGEIAYTDSVLEKFIAGLKAAGRYQNSLIVVVGDHGEGLGEHGENTHGIFLYDSTLHVPLIVRLPGARNAGKTVAAQVRTTDILPTVLEIARAAAPENLDGASLVPLFADPASSERVAIGETDYPARFGWAPLRSVRAGNAKFIEAPRPELFDLQADPGELKNAFAPDDARVTQSRALLAKLRPAEVHAGTIDSDSSGKLNALGYASSGGAGSGTLPDPKDKIEQQNLLHAAMMAGQDNRPEEARAALEKVLRLEPNSALALRQLGEVELESKQFAQAAAHLKQARAANPSDVGTMFLEGEALSAAGDPAAAREPLEAALKLNPGELRARLMLGQIHLDLQAYDAARDQFEAALLLQPDNPEAALGLARAQLGAKSYDQAQAGLEALAQSEPGNAEVFDLLAQAYNGAGKKKEAQQAAAKAALLRRGGRAR